MTHIARAALQVLDLFLPHIMVFVWLIPNILIYLWIPVSVLLYWKIWDVVYIPEQYFTCLDVLLLSGLSVYSVTVFLLLECFCWTLPSLHSSSFYFPDRNFWIKLLYIGMFLLTRQKKKYLPEACCCSWSSEKAPAGLWWKISLFLAVSTGDYWGSENCPSFTSEVKLDVLESLSSTVLSQLSNLEI